MQFQTHPIGPGAMSLTCMNGKGLMSRSNYTAVFSLVELALISLSSADFEFRDALIVSGQIISEIYFWNLKGWRSNQTNWIATHWFREPMEMPKEQRGEDALTQLTDPEEEKSEKSEILTLKKNFQTCGVNRARSSKRVLYNFPQPSEQSECF